MTEKNAKSRLARVEIPWLLAESDMSGFEASRIHSGFGRRDGGDITVEHEEKAKMIRAPSAHPPTGFSNVPKYAPRAARRAHHRGSAGGIRGVSKGTDQIEGAFGMREGEHGHAQAT